MSTFLVVIGFIMIVSDKDPTLGLLFVSMGLIFGASERRR
jgi:hypothetical protein